MTNKKNHEKTLSVLTLIVVTLSILLLCGCPSESNELKPGVQIGFLLDNETTIANYFQKIVVTNGTVDVTDFPNVHENGVDVYIYQSDTIASITGGRAAPKYFNPPLAMPQWKIGDRITVVLVPKDKTDEHAYGYWDSTYNSKSLSIRQNSGYTQGKNTMSEKIHVWSETDSSREDFFLNYQQGFVTTFTVTAKQVVIDLNFARPDTIEGEDIRLKNSNGYVYIDKRNIPNSLFGYYIYLRKVNSNDNFKIYRLPFEKISFCECNKELKLEMTPRLGYKFADNANLYLYENRTTPATKDTSSSNDYTLNVTFTTPNESGSILRPTLSENAQVELPDFFGGKSFRTIYEGDVIELTINNNKTFSLTWGQHSFVGDYAMERESYRDFDSNRYYHEASRLISTTEITKNGTNIKPNWTFEYYQPGYPNISDTITGYSISNGNYYYRWPETSDGYGIIVNLGNPITNP